MRIWVTAARPRTLPAAIAPVLVGTAAVVATFGSVPRPLGFAAALVASILIQIGTNLANDYSDARRGADTPDRLGPVRVTATGLATPSKVLWAAWIAFGLAILLGLYLAWLAGPVILLVGALSITAGTLYTGGPKPYGYAGLGEVFVFLFFGLVAVVGTAYLQSGTMLAPLAWAAAIPVGALVTAIIVVNNLRDRPTDAAAGKRTLAVSFGDRFAQAEYIALLAVGFAFPVAIALLAVRPAALLALLAIALVPPLAGPMLAVGEGSDRRALNPVLGGTARLALVASLLLAAGLALGRLGLG